MGVDATQNSDMQNEDKWTVVAVYLCKEVKRSLQPTFTQPEFQNNAF